MHLSSTIKGLLRKILPERRRKYKGDFVRRPRYEVSVVNMTSLTPVMRFKLRRWPFILAIIGTIVVIGALWMLAFIYTPIGRVLPLKLTSELRDDYIEMALRLDSIAESAAVTGAYMDNVRAILLDSIDTSEPAQVTIPDIQDIPLDSIMRTSDAERRFVESFEDAERFNLSVLSPIAAEGMAFFAPVANMTGELRMTDGPIPAAVLNTTRPVPVSAVYRGTVVSASYTSGGGATLVIQHPNGFITEYSGLSDIFVSRGDKVEAGRRIGIASSANYPFTFELWHNGSPLDPTDYIPF